MTDPSARTQRSHPATPAGHRAFTVAPFQRLARSHAASAMADAMVAASLADSLFFSLPADDARSPVVRYLIITMLPFAVIAPLIGPLIDRLKGGHRWVLVGTLLARALLCYLMVPQIQSESPTFFLLALCVLVAQRAGHVARSALVPTVVHDDDELVEANSKLAIISGIAGFLGVVPAGVLLRLGGPGWSLGLAMITFTVAMALALRIPSSRVAEEKADETERIELRAPGIFLAGSAMSLLRMCVGFLTLLIAFDFRGGDRQPWEFAIVAGASVLSQLGGAIMAPRIKARTGEENILTAALGLVVVGGLLSLVVNEVVGATILGSCVGFAAGMGKLAFDSILQRDAPDANRGRAFAKFETRFQIFYVVGAFLPVAFKMSATVGFAIVTCVAVFAVASYAIGRLSWAHRSGSRQNAATAAAVEIEQRFAEVSEEVKGRITSGPRTMWSRWRGRTVEVDEEGRPLDGGPLDGDLLTDESIDGDLTVVDAPAQRAGHVFDQDLDDDLAAGSPVAWAPEPEAEFPWEPTVDPQPRPGDYLEDVDPAVDNPFPWTPDGEAGADDPTRPHPPTGG